MSPKPIVIKTQLKYQLFTQLTIDMHLVHGILRTLKLQSTALSIKEIDWLIEKFLDKRLITKPD